MLHSSLTPAKFVKSNSLSEVVNLMKLLPNYSILYS